MVFETTLSEYESMEDEYISQKTKLISNDPKVVFSDAKVENVINVTVIYVTVRLCFESASINVLMSIIYFSVVMFTEYDVFSSSVT